jgi:hypothetical protein
MSSPAQPSLTRVEFWPDHTADLDLRELRNLAIPVKGVAYQNPLRFLELFGNEANEQARPGGDLLPDELTRSDVERLFFPKIPGTRVVLGEDLAQPPFTWREANPKHLCVSFTYNTNAIYRILSLLRDAGLVGTGELEGLLDDSCLLLARLYRASDGFLLRNINNNFNMYLISKVIEFLVGRDRYNAELQELHSTQRSLREALLLAHSHASLPLLEKMALAVGAGVTFIESRLDSPGQGLTNSQTQEVEEIAYRSYGRPLAIDHRQKLLDMVSDSAAAKRPFHLAVILDDATETVDDLLWLQDLLRLFGHLRVQLLVNTAQISINFSSHMLDQVLASDDFTYIKRAIGGQIQVLEMYCPFISFQTNFLPPEARQAIDRANAVYIKGANFFETCQIPEKESFHGFVVYGTVSRTYTGLKNFDSVFAYLPVGTSGYRHSPNVADIVTLAQIAGTDAAQSSRTTRRSQ